MLSLPAVVVLLSLASVSAGRVAGSCGPCDPAQCDPLPAEGCPAGSLLDSCGCCSVCAAGEGERCGGRGASARRCASGLECVKNDKDKKSKLGVCACKTDYEVCGSDGVTYKTGCDLKAASMRAVSEEKPEVKIQNKGRCATAPVIVTPPGDVYNVSGSQVYLSCEAIGVPTPVVTWKKISPLTKEEAGSYECHAANSKGEASAVGTIHVVESIDDIPVKKDPHLCKFTPKGAVRGPFAELTNSAKATNISPVSGGDLCEAHQVDPLVPVTRDILPSVQKQLATGKSLADYQIQESQVDCSAART
ncbi:insulin-like growth factor-binding protein 7 [Centroberyx gerrardi]